MKATIAIVVFVRALSAQMRPVRVASPMAEKPVGNVGIADVAAISNFRVHGDCNRAPARWQRMQGTLVLDNGKIVHEFWVRIDSCQSRGSVALFCPHGTSTNPDDLVEQEISLQVSMQTDTDASDVTPKCGSVPRVRPTLYEF